MFLFPRTRPRTASKSEFSGLNLVKVTHCFTAALRTARRAAVIRAQMYREGTLCRLNNAKVTVYTWRREG